MTKEVFYLTRNDCYKKGDALTPRGIVLHSTAAPGVMAMAFAERWNRSFEKGETSKQACVHAFVDDAGIVQCLPWDMRGWHAGGAANDTHIGIELCEPAGAVYNRNGTAFAQYDRAALAPYFDKVWSNAVALCAELCRTFSLDPLADGVLICHKQAHARGIASNHADVMHWFVQHDVTMEDFCKAVADKMAQPSVRWRVQVGAFASKANANALLQKLRAAGFDGYVRS